MEKPEEDIYNITINWIRHGESCANYAHGSSDKKNVPHRPHGFGKFPNKYEEDYANNKNSEEDTQKNNHASNDILYNSHPVSGNSHAYEPNLSYIGMNHAINLGNEFFFKREHIDPKNIYISSGLTRTITTALIALRFIPDAVIYVVPYINETENNNDDISNIAVPLIILKKRIRFIQEWLQKNWITRFDDIELINFLITIYEIIDVSKDTGLLPLKTKIKTELDCRKNNECRETNMKNLQQLVSDIIKIDNFEQFLFKDENQKDENQKDENQKDENQKDENQKDKLQFVIAIFKKLLNFKDNMDKFKQGPTINYRFYSYYEIEYTKQNIQNNQIYHDKLKNQQDKQKIPYPYYKNIDYFLTFILSQIQQYMIFDINTNKYVFQKDGNYTGQHIKIYAFAHGHLIKTMWSELNSDTYNENKSVLDNIFNTMVVSDNIQMSKKTNEIKKHVFNIIYIPTLIRSNYYNFEYYNQNVCDLQSIQGIINYPLLNDPSKNLNIERYPPRQDVAFYYKHDKDYYDTLPSDSFNNYKQKYLKYKQKYLNLKKKYVYLILGTHYLK